MVNIEQRVHPDLKTTLMLNFLQTRLMSSFIAATYSPLNVDQGEGYITTWYIVFHAAAARETKRRLETRLKEPGMPARGG